MKRSHSYHQIGRAIQQQALRTAQAALAERDIDPANRAASLAVMRISALAIEASDLEVVAFAAVRADWRQLAVRVGAQLLRVDPTNPLAAPLVETAETDNGTVLRLVGGQRLIEESIEHDPLLRDEDGNWAGFRGAMYSTGPAVFTVRNPAEHLVQEEIIY